MCVKTLNSKLYFIALLMVFPIFAGCASKPATAHQTASDARETRIIAEPEPAQIEEPIAPVKPDATRLVAAYNSRNFGSPGRRGVTLELITDNKLTRTFTVYNFWKQERDEVRTLFLLKEPRGLSGTSYLLIENGSHAPDMKVHLFLPSGQRRVLEVPPNNFDAGLLGSDFTYSDMRMQLPSEGYRYRVAGQSVLLNEPTWVLEAEPLATHSNPSAPWRLGRFYLARNFQFLLGADYYRNAEDGKIEARPTKQMRVESFRQIDGIWTADRIVMHSTDKRASVLILQDARFAQSNLSVRLFSPAELPSLAEEVQNGRSLDSPTSSQPEDAFTTKSLHTSGSVK